MDITPVVAIDKWIDEESNPWYKSQPLAQDWARIGKLIEELGEAISELILYTGQNPRKGQHTDRYEFILKELCDCVWTGIAALQHFTKDAELTDYLLKKRGDDLLGRIPEEYK